SGGITYSWNTGATTANIVAAPSVTTTYSVTLTDAAGCTGIGTLTVPVDLGCTATGIAPLNADGLQVEVWPNPSNGEFQVTGYRLQVTDYRLQITDLEIYNVMGEKVYSSIINSQSTIINLDQPNGIYFLKLKTGDAIFNEKIIIQK
ncbi:MAG: T9SS type A sorting domain-containing protein, partial [Bacteroidetes bacterium]